jgi:prolyl oligopeptidase
LSTAAALRRCLTASLFPSLLIFSTLMTTAPDAAAADRDPYLWLEDVDGARALAWVRAQNAVSQKALESAAGYKATYQQLLAIYDSEARIPFVQKLGERYYNFWRDAQHVRGVWRRTTLAEYRKPEPQWETVLDLDALAAREKENWVWKGVDCLYPDYDRCLVRLSRGGGDAVVVREFDTGRKQFVDGGFTVPEAKTEITWRDRDSVYVGSDFGSGSMTASGYPRTVRLWHRGTPLTDAKTIYEGQADDVEVSATVTDEPGYHREWVRRAISFFTFESYLVQHGKLVKLDLPEDADPASFQDQLLVRLRSDWKTGGRTWPGGSLLAIDLDGFLAGARDFEALFTPTPRTALAEGGFVATRHHLILETLDNVRSRLYVLTHAHGRWTREPLPTPAFATVDATAVDPDRNDDYFLTVTDFLTPTSLKLGHIDAVERAAPAPQELLKQLPAFFNTDGLQISQHEAVSKDGTRVPYFQVARAGLKLDGRNPTLLYGYGGFEVPMVPAYSGGLGSAWLERGGVYVLANIRGGGEFGPAWHEAALKQHRQRAYDDFIAVAEDLIARKLTSPRHLGIQGGSNGGLLMGVMLTQRPDLFGAVVCQVPLLDMRRYNKLLAGASWTGEYGDPDKPQDWAYIRRYSPYQNVHADRRYPPVLFMTSTRDDRVHPGHARKMAAKMLDEKHDVLYYENIEGGHGGAANNEQQAHMSALAFTFLWQRLQADAAGSEHTAAATP